MSMLTAASRSGISESDENYAEIARKRCAAARDHVLRSYGYDRVYEMILEGEGGSDGGEGEEGEKLIVFKSFLLSQAISGWALEDDTPMAEAAAE